MNGHALRLPLCDKPFATTVDKINFLRDDKKTLTLSLVVLFLFARKEDEVSVGSNNQVLTENLTEICRNSSLPGFSIAIVKNGAIAYQTLVHCLLLPPI